MVGLSNGYAKKHEKDLFIFNYLEYNKIYNNQNLLFGMRENNNHTEMYEENMNPTKWCDIF